MTAPASFFEAAHQRMQNHKEVAKQEEEAEDRLLKEVQRYQRAVQAIGETCKDVKNGLDKNSKLIQAPLASELSRQRSAQVAKPAKDAALSTTDAFSSVRSLPTPTR